MRMSPTRKQTELTSKRRPLHREVRGHLKYVIPDVVEIVFDSHMHAHAQISDWMQTHRGLERDLPTQLWLLLASR